MNTTPNENTCPRCGSPGLKDWDDLSIDQQMLVDRLPASAEYTWSERKKHRFCTRCWYEEIESSTRKI